MKKIFSALAFLFLLTFGQTVFAQSCVAKFDYTIYNSINRYWFTNSSSTGTGYSYKWDFGDGKTSTSYSTEHTYSSKGTYVVKLYVKNSISSCIDSSSQTITANNINPCKLMYEMYQINNKPMRCIFNAGNGKSYTNQYYWKLPASANHNQLDYTFSAKGSYKIEVRVDDPANHCKDTLRETVFINDCAAYFYYSLNNQTKTVNFTDYSSTTMTNYNWDFGDGKTSTTKSPTHTYSNFGTYKVTLISSGSSTKCSDTFTKYVSINCESDFSTYNYDSTISYGTSKPGATKLRWDFGDGKTASDSVGYHAYSRAGTYKVCLTVFYSKTDSCTSCYTIKAYGNSYCKSAFTSQSAGKSTIQFYDKSKGTIYHRWWNFGDGNWGNNTQNPSHSYSKPGKYWVTLMVWDSTKNCSDSSGSHQITVSSCDGDFTAIKDKNYSSIYFFVSPSFYVSGSSSARHKWIINGVNQGTSPYRDSLTHGFGKGNNTVCHVLTDSVYKCADTVCKTIWISSCRASFSAKADTANKYKIKFTPTSSSTSTMKYKWYYGDGNTSTAMNPTYIYTYYKSYNVCLEIKDSTTGCKDSTCQTVIAGIPSCDSSFSYVVRNDSLYIGYTGNGTNPIWNFGDGYIDTGSTHGFHVYSKTGNYQVCLTTYCTATKRTSKYCININIKNSNCKADFSYKADSTNMYKINFTNLSTTSSTTRYFWSTDLGGYTTPSISLTYSKTGYTYVCLDIIDTAAKCKDSVCKKIYVGKTPCDSNFYFSLRGDSLFYNYPNNATSVKWNFGNGKTSTSKAGVHVYTKSGTYTICLTAYCSSKDSSKKCLTLNIKCHLKLNFGSKLTASRTLEFTDLSSLSKNSNYWSFGDGNYSSSKNPKHTYTSPGFYRVILFTYDSTSSCSDSISKLILVTYKGPKCKADVYILRNSFDWSKFYFFSVRDTAGVLHKWTVDGVKDSSNIAAMIRTFPNAGTYKVCLYLDDTINKCKDTICTNVAVSSQCNANFTYKPDTKYKINFTSLFNGSSTTKYYWTFGNGKTSTSQNPNTTYDSIGNYTVCLYLNDTATKCRDTVCKTVSVKKPECDSIFSHAIMGDSLYFTYNGNAPNLKYYFGDGKTSTTKSGMHIYSKPGTYKVCLTAHCTNDSSNYCVTVTIKSKCQALFTVKLDTTQKFKLYLINKSSNTSSTQYTWDFGDGNYSGNRNPTHKYSKFGKFNVCLIVVDTLINCSSKYCDTLGLDSNGKLLKAGAWELVVQDESAGIGRTLKSDFKIYPNPANTKVTVDLSSSNERYNKIEIINANGQVCIVQLIEKGSEIIEIDLDRIKRGLYLIKLSNDNGYSYTKMMKN